VPISSYGGDERAVGGILRAASSGGAQARSRGAGAAFEAGVLVVERRNPRPAGGYARRALVRVTELAATASE